jgi:hypothetical protein
MNTLVNEPLAAKIALDKDTMWVELVDGRRLGVPLAYFPRLLHATPRQRSKYVISGGGIGLHWEDLDEDISVRGLLLGISDRTRPGASKRGRMLSAAKPSSGSGPVKMKSGKTGQP